MDQRAVTWTVGPKFTNSFVVLPAAQTRGSILLAVNEEFFLIYQTIMLSTNTITTTIAMRADGTQWQITLVYGPQRDDDEIQFLQELRNIHPPAHDKCPILGSFNLISTKRKAKIIQTSTGG